MSVIKLQNELGKTVMAKKRKAFVALCHFQIIINSSFCLTGIDEHTKRKITNKVGSSLSSANIPFSTINYITAVLLYEQPNETKLKSEH